MYTITDIKAAAYESKHKKNGTILFATYYTVDIYTQEEEWHVLFKANNKPVFERSGDKDVDIKKLLNAVAAGVCEMEGISPNSEQCKALVDKLLKARISVDTQDIAPIMMSNEIALGAVKIDNELYVVSSVQWNGNHVRFWSKRLSDTIISDSSTITTRDAVSTCVRALQASDCEKATRDVMHSLVTIK